MSQLMKKKEDILRIIFINFRTLVRKIWIFVKRTAESCFTEVAQPFLQTPWTVKFQHSTSEPESFILLLSDDSKIQPMKSSQISLVLRKNLYSTQHHFYPNKERHKILQSTFDTFDHSQYFLDKLDKTFIFFFHLSCIFIFLTIKIHNLLKMLIFFLNDLNTI